MLVINTAFTKRGAFTYPRSTPLPAYMYMQNLKSKYAVGVDNKAHDQNNKIYLYLYSQC